MAEIRLLLVDDHTLFRKGTRLLLDSEAGFQVVAEAANGAQALEQARLHTPDVIAMDVAMEGGDGIEATKAIVAELPQSRVLVLTMHGDDAVFDRALRAGASGYVLKESAPEELITAVRVLAGGGFYLTPLLTKRLVQRYLQRTPGRDEMHDYAALTTRELEVLRLIGEGHINREIGNEMSLTVSTVQTHRTHIMQKLNLGSRAELMRAAVHLGMQEGLDPGG